MKSLQQNILLIGILASTITIPCLAQKSQSTKVSVPTLLTKLHSEDWTERKAAYDRVESDQAALKEARVQESLLDLLDRENQLVEATNRNEQGPSVDEKYGEAYGEYIAAVGKTVDTFADWSDPRQVCIFVREVYSPNSLFAAKIASHGKVAIPCLLKMYASNAGLARADAAAVLVQALAKSDDLDPGVIETSHQTIVKALHDPHEAVRSHTVDALAKFGTADMIPALTAVASSDPSFEDNEFWIREKAAKAILEIQKRSGG